MIAEKKQASLPKLAETNIERKESYRKKDNQSNPNLKEFLGVLLLRLIAGQAEPKYWQLFDGLLRRFYAGSGERFHRLKSTNSTQRVSE